MNNRVKLLRKELNLNQKDFADRLGVTAAGISRIEGGKRRLTEQMLLMICKEFCISEAWLRNGEGEIFTQQPSSPIGELKDYYRLDELDMKIIYEYVTLDDRKRSIIKEYIMKIAGMKPSADIISDGDIRNEVLKCAEGPDMSGKT